MSQYDYLNKFFVWCTGIVLQEYAQSVLRKKCLNILLYTISTVYCTVVYCSSTCIMLSIFSVRVSAQLDSALSQSEQGKNAKIWQCRNVVGSNLSQSEQKVPKFQKLNFLDTTSLPPGHFLSATVFCQHIWGKKG